MQIKIVPEMSLPNGSRRVIVRGRGRRRRGERKGEEEEEEEEGKGETRRV